MASSSSQTPQQLFSGGREMSNLMLSCGILQNGWESVSEIQQLPNKAYSLKRLPKVNIFAFGRQQPPPASPPLQKLDKDHPLGFLITKDNPDISLHQSPLLIFDKLFEELKQQLKELTDKKQPQLILVGQSLGGSVAALFALWLLKNRPQASFLEIPGGATAPCEPNVDPPLLQKAINKVDQWKAQFWHVADIDNAIPRIPPSAELKPYGTYFLCSDSGSTCISDPESVLALLQATTGAENHHTNYRDRLKQLKQKITLRERSSNIEQMAPLRVGLAMQLEAIGVRSTDSGHQKLLSDMEEREKDEFVRKNSVLNPSKKLNDAKKQMAQLEWYMKSCDENKKEYYECFKSRRTQPDIDVIDFKNNLNKYWKEMVEKSETQPQTKDVQLRDRWLFSGTTYRRMVEPLDIAEYYRKPSNRDYMNKGRSEHYKKLEAWQKEADRPKVKDKAPSLTEDSCFWAQVEEATIKVAELKKPELDQGQQETIMKELKGFEDYVWKMVEEKEVSRKVFTIPDNPFLRWWEDYKGFLQPSNYRSLLGNTINNPDQYK